MRFELTEYHKKISTEELLQDLKDTAHKLNVISMSMQEYDLSGTYSSSAVVRRFGSWNHALELSGLEYRNQYFEEIELFENLEKVWIKIGKQPTRRDMDDKNISNVSSGAYLRKFGKWSVALKRFVEFVDKTYDISNTDERTTFTHKTKRDVNLRLRFLVMQRDNFKCCSCGASPAKDPNVILHIDHIIPWSKGGETVIDNLQTLCSKCNLGKSNTFFE